MKKLLAVAALCLAFSVSAQKKSTRTSQNALTKGDMMFNAGVGLSSWGVPVYAGLDYSVTDDITIGGELSYRSKNEDYHFAKFKHTVFGVAVNGNYHFNRILKLPKEFDLYGGVSLGYYNWNSKYEGDGEFEYSGSYASGVGFAAQIGGRYFFTDKFGLNLEFGGGNVSGGKAGITYKF